MLKPDSPDQEPGGMGSFEKEWLQGIIAMGRDSGVIPAGARDDTIRSTLQRFIKELKAQKAWTKP
eukprot:12713777-Heterocapsa_arctica.AAC.1